MMPFVQAGARFGQRRRLRIEIDVIGDEQVEVAVAVVVDKGAAGVPPLQARQCALSTPAFAATSVNVPSPLLR